MKGNFIEYLLFAKERNLNEKNFETLRLYFESLKEVSI